MYKTNFNTFFNKNKQKNLILKHKKRLFSRNREKTEHANPNNDFTNNFTRYFVIIKERKSKQKQQTFANKENLQPTSLNCTGKLCHREVLFKIIK